MNLDFEKIIIEQVDIIGETKTVLSELRKHAAEVKTEENLAQYDDGIKHALTALDSVINSINDEGKDRLIYQKHGFSSPYLKWHVSLEKALKEIYGGD